MSLGSNPQQDMNNLHSKSPLPRGDSYSSYFDAINTTKKITFTFCAHQVLRTSRKELGDNSLPKPSGQKIHRICFDLLFWGCVPFRRWIKVTGSYDRNNGIFMEILTSTLLLRFVLVSCHQIPEISHHLSKFPIFLNITNLHFAEILEKNKTMVFGFSPFYVRETLEGLPWHHGAWSAGSTPDPRLLPAHPTLVDGHKISKDFKVAKTIVRNGVK